MPTDEDMLRRIVREEVAAALRDAFGERPRRGANGHPVDPAISAKRADAANHMWALMKAKKSTRLSTATAAARRASKPAKQESLFESTTEDTDACKLHANVHANVHANEQTPTTRAFLGYAGAYRQRYGEFPVRNAKSNALLTRLVGRLGKTEAAPVAEYYVGLTDKLYVASGHCLDLLLRDAEKIRLLWKQGATTTGPGASAKPWWEVWSALEAQGADLGIEQGDNPTIFRNAVLRAAYVAGRLPDLIAEKLGVDRDPPVGA